MYEIIIPYCTKSVKSRRPFRKITCLDFFNSSNPCVFSAKTLSGHVVCDMIVKRLGSPINKQSQQICEQMFAFKIFVWYSKDHMEEFSENIL